jgi:hypothetical protein
MAKLSRAEQAALEAANKAKKLPAPFKMVMYGSVIWCAVGGWLYTSGWWASKKYGCTVEVSTLDGLISDSIAVAGIIAIITIISGFYHLENSK